MGKPADVAALSASAALAIAIAAAIFGHGQGGGLPVSGWFSWHPVLMTMAFPGLMSIGRLSYVADSSWPGLESKENRRKIHRIIMSLSVLAMLGGYLCIFKAHWPAQKFFGYDFKKGEWAAFARVAHAWIGYAAIALSLYQAGTGMAKMSALSQGQRVFTNHGTVGKCIMGTGLAAVLLATYFWAWSTSTKVAVAGLSVAAVSSSFLLSTPDSKEERQPIIPSAEEGQPIMQSVA
mmetsp:Transcript_81191/g.263144  ORF Transcript_81191/g.263144 Transcript_81191/m.263144 type:complete len:235 (+) Transcript_81191:98-802(+)